MTNFLTISPSKIRDTVVSILILSLFAVCTGTLCSIAVILFVEALEALNDLWIQPFDHYRGLKTPWQTILLTIAIPTTGGVLVALLCNRISGQRAHGIPETIKASHSVHCRLSATDGLKSALAAILSIGCGASVGQYGPLVHLGTTLGSLVDK